MTSYSTYGAGRMTLVDGSLHHDEEIRAEQLDTLTNVLAAGAARALLDSTHDLNDSMEGGVPDDVYAEQWHSATAGWEIEAIHDSDREAFVATVRKFVTENAQAVLNMGSRIAWDERFASELWHGDDGMGLYRVGMLLGYSGAGQGIGFDDYHDGTQYYTDANERLNAWVKKNVNYWWEQSWVDSTEEPCLLHLSL